MSLLRSSAVRGLLSVGLLAVPLLAGVVAAQPASAAHRTAHKTWTVKEEPGKNGTYVFSPAKLTIQAGDTVKWVDVNSVPHNIVGTDAASKKLIKRTDYNAKPYSVTFKTKGTYHYECQIHLPAMKGAITVK